MSICIAILLIFVIILDRQRVKFEAFNAGRKYQYQIDRQEVQKHLHRQQESQHQDSGFRHRDRAKQGLCLGAMGSGHPLREHPGARIHPMLGSQMVREKPCRV